MEYKTTTIELRNPIYQADSIFEKWAWKDSWGFGIKESLLFGYGCIRINTKYGDFKIDKVFAKALADKYKLRHIARKSTRLVVVPRQLCDRL